MQLRHGRISIQLHELSAARGADRAPLLLLHSLGSSASEWSDLWNDEWKDWNGPVYALDFAGHGQSEYIAGRSYYPELFLVDADLALAAIGDRACVAGAGVGAYVAMLLAGSRPDRICAALLLPGRGLSCGGSSPDFDRRPQSVEAWEAQIQQASLAYSKSTDPFVATCERDIRPLDYVSDFASAAERLLFSEAVDPKATDDDSLDWWQAARESSGGKTVPARLATALRELAGCASSSD